jgi:phage shock protein A
VDPLIDRTIDKLLDREASRLRDVKRRLESQVAEFERQYSMVSQDFSTRFATGELGDHVDYMEWASSLAMISNIDGQLTILGRLNNEYDHREAL